MTEKPRTFDKAWEEYQRDHGRVGDGFAFNQGWHARDEEVATKDHRIAELDEELVIADEWRHRLQVQIDRVRALAEAAGHLAWATEVEIQGGRRTRGFISQHRTKCHHWITEVRKLITALGEPAATPEREL